MKHNTLTILALMLATSLSSQAAITMATRLDASLFTSAGAISTWEDSSFYTDSDHDATATGDPTVVLGALNGNAVVRFDGNDHFVIDHTYTTGTAFIVTEYDFTIFPTGGSSEGLYGAATGFGATEQYFTGAGSTLNWANEAGGNLSIQNGWMESKRIPGLLTRPHGILTAESILLLYLSPAGKLEETVDSAPAVHGRATLLRSLCMKMR